MVATAVPRMRSTLPPGRMGPRSENEWNNYATAQSPYSGREGFGCPTPSKRLPRRTMTPSAVVRKRVSIGRRSIGDVSSVKRQLIKKMVSTIPASPQETAPEVEAVAPQEEAAPRLCLADEPTEPEPEPVSEALASTPAPTPPPEHTEAVAPSPRTDPFGCDMDALITSYKVRQSLSKEPNFGPEGPLTSRVSAEVEEVVDEVEADAEAEAEAAPIAEECVLPSEENEAPVEEGAAAAVEEEEAAEELFPVARSHDEAPATARKSVTFRSPLTDVKQQASSRGSPSPMVIPTPRTRLSFSYASEDSMERVRSEVEGLCSLTGASPLSPEGDGGLQMQMPEPNEEGVEIVFRKKRETIVKEDYCESIISAGPDDNAEDEDEENVSGRPSTGAAKPKKRETIVLERNDDASDCTSEASEEAEVSDSESSQDDESPSKLTYRELQLAAKSLGVPANGKKSVLIAQVRKARAAGAKPSPEEADEEEASQGGSDLEQLSYRELQTKAKALGISAAGRRTDIIARIESATIST